MICSRIEFIFSLVKNKDYGEIVLNGIVDYFHAFSSDYLKKKKSKNGFDF